MKKELLFLEKNLFNDYIIRFPSENHIKNPKLEEITISTNLNNKKRGNIYKVDSSKDIKSDIRILMKYYISIYGQTPKKIKVKKSVASWNIRQGMENGVLVTLRSSGRMGVWLKRWKNMILPRIILMKWSDLRINSKNKKDKYAGNIGIPSILGMAPIGGIAKEQLKNEEHIIKELKKMQEERGARITFKVKGGVQREFILRYYGLPTKIELSNKMNL